MALQRATWAASSGRPFGLQDVSHFSNAVYSFDSWQIYMWIAANHAQIRDILQRAIMALTSRSLL